VVIFFLNAFLTTPSHSISLQALSLCSNHTTSFGKKHGQHNEHVNVKTIAILDAYSFCFVPKVTIMSFIQPLH